MSAKPMPEAAMPEVIELVPRDRIAAFEAAGWRKAERFCRSHHGHWSAMMSRPGRAGDTPDGIMAESARLRQSTKPERAAG